MPSIYPGESLSLRTFQSACEHMTDSQIFPLVIWMGSCTPVMFMPITYVLPHTSASTTLLHVGHVQLSCCCSLVSYISDHFYSSPHKENKSILSCTSCLHSHLLKHVLFIWVFMARFESSKESKTMHVCSWARHLCQAQDCEMDG